MYTVGILGLFSLTQPYKKLIKKEKLVSLEFVPFGCEPSMSWPSFHYCYCSLCPILSDLWEVGKVQTLLIAQVSCHFLFFHSLFCPFFLLLLLLPPSTSSSSILPSSSSSSTYYYSFSSPSSSSSPSFSSSTMASYSSCIHLLLLLLVVIFVFFFCF